VPYLSTSAVVFHYKEALYQVYIPLPFENVAILDITAARMMELVVTN